MSPALRWDLTKVGWMHSHINDLFLHSQIHYSAEISLRWNISPGLNGFSHINSSLLTSGQEFIEIEDWLRLIFFLYFSYIHSMSHIKEYRCLKNVIHQIDRNEWTLPSISKVYDKILICICRRNTGKRFSLEVSF